MLQLIFYKHLRMEFMGPLITKCDNYLEYHPIVFKICYRIWHSYLKSMLVLNSCCFPQLLLLSIICIFNCNTLVDVNLSHWSFELDSMAKILSIFSYTYGTPTHI